MTVPFKGRSLTALSPEVVNTVGDARVVRVHFGLTSSGIPGYSRRFAPPARVEDALAPALRDLEGLRRVCLELTSGGRLWLGPNLELVRYEEPERAESTPANTPRRDGGNER